METSNSKTGKNDHSSNSHMMASGRAISSAPIATSAYPAGMSSNLGQQGRGFPATGTAFRPQQQQPQAQQQDVNTPQFLQLVSSLMGNTNNTSNNGNSSAGSFMSLGSNDLLSMAQRMGIFQQQQQQQQQQKTPNNSAGLQGLPTISQAQCLPTASSVTGIAQSSPPPPQKQDLFPQKMQPSLETPAVVQPTAEPSGPQTKKLKTNTGHQLTRIPCRARGMNMDHNFETAYFTISEDMKHGSPLVCSYPACRDKGVKFLYCAFCKDTGAKRQFRERHNHGADDETVRRSSQVSQTPTETPSTSATKVPRAGGKLKTAPGTSDNEALPIGKRKRTTIEVVAAATHNTSTSMEDATTSSMDRRKGPLQDLDEAIAQSAIDVEDKRMKVWTALLSSRPKDNNDDGIASWLMNAMAVSDVSRPIQEVVEELERNPNVPKFTNIKSSTAPAVALSVQATTSSTDLEDSNDSFSSGKRSSSTDGQTNTQDGSSNDSNEDTSTDNQDANSDEQDPTSSSPNDSSDDDYQMDAEAGMAIDGEKQGSGV